jgi:hypothetical protein
VARSSQALALSFLRERNDLAEVGFGQSAVSLPEAQFSAHPVDLGLDPKFFGIRPQGVVESPEYVGDGAVECLCLSEPPAAYFS